MIELLKFIPRQQFFSRLAHGHLLLLTEGGGFGLFVSFLFGRWIANVAAVRAVRAIWVILFEATAINAGSGHATLSAALPAFAIIKFVVVRSTHGLYPFA
jgi:hypothetical protein